MNPHQRDNNKAGTEEQDDDLTHFKSPMVLSQEETKTKFLQKTIIRAHLNKPV